MSRLNCYLYRQLSEDIPVDAGSLFMMKSAISDTIKDSLLLAL